MNNKVIMEPTYWGKSTSIDLHSCNPSKIRSNDIVEQFVIKLCDLIKMKMFGKPVIVKFGNTPEIEGITLVQLIETSSITAHFSNYTNSAYIDVFSCKNYDEQSVVIFCKEYFEANNATYKMIKRY